MAKRAPSVPTRGGPEAQVYDPRPAGEKVVDYDDNPHKPPEDEDVQELKPLAPVPPKNEADPEAPNILQVMGSKKFKEPFTVSLMRRTGEKIVLRTDAGTKVEDEYEICSETVRRPADLLRLISGVAGGSYKLLNNNSIELQAFMHLAASSGVLEDVTED